MPIISKETERQIELAMGDLIAQINYLQGDLIVADIQKRAINEIDRYNQLQKCISTPNCLSKNVDERIKTDVKHYFYTQSRIPAYDVELITNKIMAEAFEQFNKCKPKF